MGTFGGASVTLFMLGASIANRENEAYMEGYLAGQVKGIMDKE